MDKYVTAEHLMWSLVLLGSAAAAAALAAAWAPTRGRSTSDGWQSPALAHATLWLYRLTLIAYGLWGLRILSSGAALAALADVLSGDARAVTRLKRAAGPVAGVTTFTQLGPVVVAACAASARAAGRSVLQRPVLVLIGLGLIRSWLNSERLAIIEVLVPLAIVLFFVAPRRASAAFAITRQTAPAAVPLALFVLFGIFEHGRSWATYWQYKYDGAYSAFVRDRVLGYYATASNNSSLALENLGDQLPLPYFTVKSFWTFPGLSNVAGYERLTGQSPPRLYREMLQTFGNPEFNNEGGLLIAAADFGYGGALLFWLLLGGALGLLFGLMRSDASRWLPLYAASFIGILEVSRIPYWGSGRFLPALLAGIWIAYVQRGLPQLPKLSMVRSSRRRVLRRRGRTFETRVTGSPVHRDTSGSGRDI